MKTYRIFLASSAELSHERLAFVAFIHDYNKELKKYNISLEVEWWEDLDDHFNTSSKQQDYNEALKECHFLLMLFWTKVGKYTLEEFNLGRKLFAEKGLPYVYCYEKKCSEDKELQSKKDFLSSINKSGEEQFQTSFDDFVKVTEQFRKNFQRLLDDKNNLIIVHNTQAAITLSTKAADEPQGFLGREEELKTIREKLGNQGGKLMLINAEGGIGKTTLAAKYWNDSLHEYKHNAWLFCDGGIINALKDLAPKLNLDLAGMDEQQQLNALRLALSEKQDDFLLVLDNANDEEDIKVFRQEFEGFHWHVLITSRCQGVLDREQELPITHLPPPLAKELFERYYKDDSPDFDATLDKVLHAIQYHTLLTEVFAKNLAEAAELGHLNLASFLAKLENEGLHLGKDSFEIEHNAWAEKRKAATTDEILDALYDFGQLSPEQDFIMVNMALLPAEPYTLAFINSLLANDSNRQDRQIRENLKTLVKKGWIGETEKKYRLSPVIQKLVLEKHQESLGQDSLPILVKLNEWTVADGYNLLRLSLTEATTYVTPIGHINACLKDHPSLELATYNFNAGIYFGNKGDIVNAKAVHQNYGNIYVQLLESSPENLSYKNGLAISYEKLGGIYEQTGDWKNALLNYQEYNRLEKEITESSPENLSYKNGLAISYEKLGGIYEQTGDWKNALLNYQERNRIGKEIYESSPENLSYKNGLAISYEKLGGNYEQTGDWKNALLNYQEYNRLEKEITESSPENLSYKNNLAISHEKLGGIYEQTGDWKNALLNYQEDFRITKEIYESSPENLSYKNGLAISYEKLGGIYEQTGDWKNALLNYQEQLRIFKEIYESSPENLSYKNGLAISYEKLGEIYEQTGDWKNALLNYQEDFRITKEIYESSPENLSYKNGLAISYSKLGGIYEQTGDWKNALLNYQEQLRIFKEIYESSPENLSYKNGLAISYSKLGGIYEQTGDWKNALLNYQERNRIGKEIYESSSENLSYKKGLAISLARLGTFHLKQNELGQSLQYFMESRQHFAELWQATQGQIVQYAYYFAMNTRDVTRIVKHLIEQKQYPAEQEEDIKASIKAMRQEGKQAIEALAAAGVLQEGQKWLVDELGDEGWYGF